MANLHMTMKIHSVFLIGLFLFVSACANDPYDSPKEITEACNFELQAAFTAVKLRDKGKPKLMLLSKLGPLSKDSSRLLVNMYQIVDEIYTHNDLDTIIYPAYRYELCQRQLLFKPHPLTIKPVLPMLKQCQESKDTASAEQATECIVTGLNTFNKKD